MVWFNLGWYLHPPPSHERLIPPSQSGLVEGTVNVLSRHTTTAVTINENETRLMDDVRQVGCGGVWLAGAYACGGWDVSWDVGMRWTQFPEASRTGQDDAGAAQARLG